MSLEQAILSQAQQALQTSFHFDAITNIADVLCRDGCHQIDKMLKMSIMLSRSNPANISVWFW